MQSIHPGVFFSYGLKGDQEQLLGWHTGYKNLLHFQYMVGYLELRVAIATSDIETVPRLAFNPSLTEIVNS